MFDTQYTPIPPGLDEMEPGPELAAVLEGIDVDQVSPYDRIVVLRAEQRMESHYQARQYHTISAVVDALDEDHPQYGRDEAAWEIRAALRLTRRGTETLIGFACDLYRRLPQVWSALLAGYIDYRRARVLSLGTLHLTPGTAWEVVERVLPDAGELTSGQLRARLDKIAIAADPELARNRYQDAVGDRRLVLEANDTGTANLLMLDLGPDRATAAARYVDSLARSLKTKDETRTIDQLRADVAADLLIGKTHTGGKSLRGGLEVHVTLDTLLERSENPGELAGYGAVVADIARQVAADSHDAEWRYTVHDPDTGHVLHEGTTRRRPTAALRRRAQARHRTCIFPGCRMPAVDCDLDHRIRWSEGGRTCECNQYPLCRHDHPSKDRHGWRYRPLADGRIEWTSKLGHVYYTSGRSP